MLHPYQPPERAATMRRTWHSSAGALLTTREGGHAPLRLPDSCRDEAAAQIVSGPMRSSSGRAPIGWVAPCTTPASE